MTNNSDVLFEKNIKIKPRLGLSNALILSSFNDQIKY